MYITLTQGILNKILALKEQKNITNEEIAQRTQLGAAHISRLLNGKSNSMQTKTWQKFLDVFPELKDYLKEEEGDIDIQYVSTKEENAKNDIKLLDEIKNCNFLTPEEKGMIVEWLNTKSGKAIELEYDFLQNRGKILIFRLLKTFMPYIRQIVEQEILIPRKQDEEELMQEIKEAQTKTRE